MLTKRDRFWTILLIAAIISAVVSFFTTALGLLHYISFILAIPLALAVQMGLFGLAWLIGFGNRRIRGLMIGLYLFTMIFSVTFSYVFLQSELVEKVKPIEAQRTLLDDIRIKYTAFGNIVHEALNESDLLMTKLDLWLKAEEEKGWATKTCEEENHCYLLEVCSRVRGKIELWEEKFGRPYREGPGRELIHGALNEEQALITNIHNRLKDFRDITWQNSDVLAEGSSNRARLTKFDQLVASIPKRDMEAVLCRKIELPISPAYVGHARDNAISEEKQLYAFNDLLDILSGSRSFERSDYPTIFALGLALFIDLFVLIVAIGAALIDVKRENLLIPDTDEISTEWSDRQQKDISEWIEGALLGQVREKEDMIAFTRELLKTIIVNREGQNVLVPLNDEQYRFGVILVKSKAASVTRSKIDGEEKTVFELDNWVYLALMRYVRSKEPQRETTKNGARRESE
ncbi:MAG: hypothetical protein PVI66_02430 [Candidatus Aminicenantes bacterium]|jgi:hypothetical protein